MARMLPDDSPARPALLAAADHQCQGESVRGRGQAKTTERCIHTDRGGWRLVAAIDDARGPLILCELCFAKLQAPISRRASRAVLPGQTALF